MPKREPNYHGLLIVDKPGRLELSSQCDTKLGSLCTEDAPKEADLPTSHDIVQMARRWCHQRRIGHTGTLDPMASGLLILCLGSATRLVEYYQNHDKEYTAQICLGTATDTYDAMGQVVASAPVPELEQRQIEDALSAFRGTIWQTPPLFSAIKQGGESLHRKARRGETVTIEARQVTIHKLDLLEFSPPNCLTLQIACSAGTYIRSLAHDLGQALQTHAHLNQLRRTKVGTFTLEQAHSPAAITQATDERRLSELILPIGYGLTMPVVHLTEDEIRRFGYGQTVLLRSKELEQSAFPAAHLSGNSKMLAVALDQVEGGFAGIIRRLDDEEISHPTSTSTMSQNSRLKAFAWKAEKWFANS